MTGILEISCLATAAIRPGMTAMSHKGSMGLGWLQTKMRARASFGALSTRNRMPANHQLVRAQNR